MLIVHLIMRNIDRKCYEAFEQEDDLRMHINNAHEGNLKFEIKICCDYTNKSVLDTIKVKALLFNIVTF